MLAADVGDQHYTFEFIHDEEATQEEVFEESVLNFADEALLAQNVAILCYGPTGSGKTYSMMGQQHDHSRSRAGGRTAGGRRSRPKKKSTTPATATATATAAAAATSTTIAEASKSASTHATRPPRTSSAQTANPVKGDVHSQPGGAGGASATPLDSPLGELPGRDEDSDNAHDSRHSRSVHSERGEKGKSGPTEERSNHASRSSSTTSSASSAGSNRSAASAGAASSSSSSSSEPPADDEEEDEDGNGEDEWPHVQQMWSRRRPMLATEDPNKHVLETGEMGILPRLVHVLLDRRDETMTLLRESEVGAGGGSASPSATSLGEAAGGNTRRGASGRPSASPGPSALTGGSRKQEKQQLLHSVSLTLRELTFYGIEIYVDEVSDLLDPAKRRITTTGDTGGLAALCQRLNQARQEDRGQRGGGAASRGGGGMAITSMEDLRVAYRLARRNRVTSRHAKNDTSSRSHAIFILQLGFDLCDTARTAYGTGVAHNSTSGGAVSSSAAAGAIAGGGGGEGGTDDVRVEQQRVNSYVAMVDLAGCERVKETQVQGAALREARYINKSLSALSSVVLALTQHSSHVPYRDSKLTRLLRPCLEGGRVLTLVHVSPCSSADTINSLKFADQIRHTRVQSHGFGGRKRELLDIFEGLIDPAQGVQEEALRQAEHQYAQLCAEIRLAYLSRNGGVDNNGGGRALRGSPRGARRGTKAFESLDSNVEKGEGGAAAAATGDREQAEGDAGMAISGVEDAEEDDRFDGERMDPDASPAAKRAFMLRTLVSRHVASLRAEEEQSVQEAVHLIERERDRRVEQYRKRKEQEIEQMMATIDEITRYNAQLAQENTAPLPRDSYSQELARQVKETTDELAECVKERQTLTSLVTVLRQRVAIQDELDAAVTAEVQEALRKNGVALKNSPTSGEDDTATQLLLDGSSQSSLLLTATCCSDADSTAMDAELREVCYQQVLLSKEMSALRMEAACFALGDRVWEGLWGRAMREELLTALRVERALMEATLLDPPTLRALVGDTGDADGGAGTRHRDSHLTPLFSASAHAAASMSANAERAWSVPSPAGEASHPLHSLSVEDATSPDGPHDASSQGSRAAGVAPTLPNTAGAATATTEPSHEDGAGPATVTAEDEVERLRRWLRDYLHRAASTASSSAAAAAAAATASRSLTPSHPRTSSSTAGALGAMTGALMATDTNTNGDEAGPYQGRREFTLPEVADDDNSTALTASSSAEQDNFNYSGNMDLDDEDDEDDNRTRWSEFERAQAVTLSPLSQALDTNSNFSAALAAKLAMERGFTTAANSTATAAAVRRRAVRLGENAAQQLAQAGAALGGFVGVPGGVGVGGVGGGGSGVLILPNPVDQFVARTGTNQVSAVTVEPGLPAPLTITTHTEVARKIPPPVMLTGCYDDEELLQRASVKKLMEEGIPCEVCCVGDSFDVVFERYLCPPLAPTLAEDDHPDDMDSTSITATDEPGTTIAATGGDGTSANDARRGGAGGQSGAARPLTSGAAGGRRSRMTTNTATASTASAASTSGPSNARAAGTGAGGAAPREPPPAMTSRWGRLRLTRSNKRDHAYCLEFVFSHHGLPMPPNVTAAIAAAAAPPAKTHVEELVDSLPAPLDRRGYTPSFHTANTFQNARRLKERRLFSIPLDEAQLRLQLHVMEAGTARTTPAINANSGARVKRVESNTQVALEVHGIPLVEGQHQKLFRMSQATRGLAQSLADDGLTRDDFGGGGAGSAGVTARDVILAKRLDGGGELVFPSPCILSNKGVCTVVLHFPTNTFSPSTRLESVEAIVAGLCAVTLPTRTGAATTSNSTAPAAAAAASAAPPSTRETSRARSPAPAPSPSPTTSSSLLAPREVHQPGGRVSVVCGYSHVPYVLLYPEVSERGGGKDGGAAAGGAKLPTRLTRRGVSGSASRVSPASTAYVAPLPPPLPTTLTHSPEPSEETPTESRSSPGVEAPDDSHLAAAPRHGSLEGNSGLVMVPGATMQVFLHFPGGLSSGEEEEAAITSIMVATDGGAGANSSPVPAADGGPQKKATNDAAAAGEGGKRKKKAGEESQRSGKGGSTTPPPPPPSSSSSAATASTSPAGKKERRAASASANTRSGGGAGRGSKKEAASAAPATREASTTASGAADTVAGSLARAASQSVVAPPAEVRFVHIAAAIVQQLRAVTLGPFDSSASYANGRSPSASTQVCLRLQQLLAFRRNIRALVKQQIYDAADVKGDLAFSSSEQQLFQGSHLLDIQEEAKSAIGLSMPPLASLAGVAAAASNEQGDEEDSTTPRDNAPATSHPPTTTTTTSPHPQHAAARTTSSTAGAATATTTTAAPPTRPSAATSPATTAATAMESNTPSTTTAGTGDYVYGEVTVGQGRELGGFAVPWTIWQWAYRWPTVSRCYQQLEQAQQQQQQGPSPTRTGSGTVTVPFPFSLDGRTPPAPSSTWAPVGSPLYTDAADSSSDDEVYLTFGQGNWLEESALGSLSVPSKTVWLPELRFSPLPDYLALYQQAAAPSGSTGSSPAKPAKKA